MAKFFGTDGIRGIANQEPMTPEMGIKLGRAVVLLSERHGKGNQVVIGRDTRASGEMLEYAIVSGVLSAGGRARQAGVLPTPGVAFLTREVGAGAGVMVSASHNPYEYNGFKVFSHEGYKLTDREEVEIEEMLLHEAAAAPQRRPHPGDALRLEDARERYLSFLRKTLAPQVTLEDMRVILDCANGAAFQVALPLFESMGADAEALFVQPDGKNINEGCGSQHPEPLRREVVRRRAHVGLAFDGDGDRIAAVDEKGQVLTGDQIMIICAKMLRDRGRLKNNLVVSTVMSNIGFRLGLANLGIEHVSSPVGDRQVLEKMRASGAVLGGEDSGHIIFHDDHTTGDGLLSGLQLLAAMKTSGQPLSKLSQLMTVYPQVLVNVPVQCKRDLSTVPDVRSAIERVERALRGRGRVLVRYSGTEPICRVMVEGEKKEQVERYASQIAEAIRGSANEPDRP
jgi:phosphoglucosamine mutase